jgi:uncharacterized protein YeaO (DUF488 family)
MLTVYTSRLSYGGPDRFDITRKNATMESAPFAPYWALVRGAKTGEIPWDRYVDHYTQQMRVSYKDHRKKWDALLSRDVVTLVCFCVDPNRCHRTVLAGILGKLGARVGGER